MANSMQIRRWTGTTWQSCVPWTPTVQNPANTYIIRTERSYTNPPCSSGDYSSTSYSWGWNPGSSSFVTHTITSGTEYMS